MKVKSYVSILTRDKTYPGGSLIASMVYTASVNFFLIIMYSCIYPNVNIKCNTIIHIKCVQHTHYCVSGRSPTGRDNKE